MYCIKCGKEIDDNVIFCTHCGARQKEISEKTTPTENKRNTKRMIAIVVAVAVVAMVVCAISFVRHSSANNEVSQTETKDVGQDVGQAGEQDGVQAGEQDGQGNAVDSLFKQEETEIGAKDNVAKISTGNEAASDTVDRSGTQISAADAETTLRAIDKDMQSYIWVILMQEYSGNGGVAADRIDVDLSGAEKIRAAVLASQADGVIDSVFVDRNGILKVDETAEAGPDGDGLHGTSVSKESVETKCLNLFGTEADWNALQKTVQNDLFDAVLYSQSGNDYAIQLNKEIETETDQESHEFRVKQNGDGYDGEVDMFWGYWGDLQADPDLSNYTVHYNLRPGEKSEGEKSEGEKTEGEESESERSEYGLVIDSMSITRKDDTESGKGRDTESDKGSNKEPDTESGKGSGKSDMQTAKTAHAPFYGIWCSAAKDMNEAQQSADKLKSAGLDAVVFVTTDWSNLNKERWYVVTAGVYDTEEKANEALAKVKDSGYSGAYVKYSGEYLGDS